MALLQRLQWHFQMEINMWTQLQTRPLVQARLFGDETFKTLLDEPVDDVTHAYTQSLPVRKAWSGHPRQNQILAALPEPQYAAMAESLELVNLKAGQLIYERGHALQHVYFPTTCTASLFSSTADGETAELGLTGCHGLIGVPLVLGATSMEHSVQIQSAGQAYRMPAERFVRWLGECDQLQQLSLSYVQSLMAQMAQSIVCSRHHSVSERLSQWVLWNSEGLASDELSVTHETIAHMLGVRRESVTQAAGRLQNAGVIRTSRGKITICDRESLMHSVCECYERIQSESVQHVQRMNRLSQRPVSQGVQYGMTPEPVQPLSTQQDLQKYVDVYDFAPVGLVTLNTQARVTQTNLAGAILLDIQRSQCQNKSFMDLLDEPSRAIFMAFHHEVLSGQCRRYCVVSLPATAHRPAVTLRIDATSDESGEENRMVLIDLGAEHRGGMPADVPMAAAWQFQTHAATAVAGCRPA